MREIKDLKIALIHEWLVSYAGSERVIEQILKVYPHADLFCLLDILPQGEREFLGAKKVHTSFLQSLPFKAALYRHFLPLMPLAVEQFDLSEYDVIISNCHAVSKGVITRPSQLHLSYVHTPIRYAWDMQSDYLKAGGFRGVTDLIARVVLHYLRMWDIAASSRPDLILANSSFIAQRIQKYYRRQSEVLYPPVDTDFFTYKELKDDYYLAASRLVPYKKIDLIVQAFRAMPDKKLIVLGDGPDRTRIQALSKGNVRWLGYQDATVVREYMQNARAFVFAGKEDFGITPLEAQACGTPVIAFGEGGLRETIRGLETPIPTGVFFFEQTTAAIQEAVKLFESKSTEFSPLECRKNAERFSNERFRREFQDYLLSAWRELQ